MIEESQRVGWLMKKRVKWPRLQQRREQQENMQFSEKLRKLEHRRNVWLECIELRAAELRK